MLHRREVEDIDAVDRAELDVADPVSLQDIELLEGVLGDLVGEGAVIRIIGGFRGFSRRWSTRSIPILTPESQTASVLGGESRWAPLRCECEGCEDQTPRPGLHPESAETQDLVPSPRLRGEGLG